jgi:hypothetical protein
VLDVSRRPLVKDDLLLHLASHAPTQLRVLDVSLTVSPAGSKQRRQCSGCAGCRLLVVPSWSIPVATGTLLVVPSWSINLQVYKIASVPACMSFVTHRLSSETRTSCS